MLVPHSGGRIVLSGKTQSLKICHQYRHRYGRLTSFFEALARGEALGAECSTCNKLFFPPQPFCQDCSAKTSEVSLAPTGIVESVTYGAVEHDKSAKGIALVCFGGATNLAMVHVDADSPVLKVGDRVGLSPVENHTGHASAHLRVTLEI